MEKLLDSYCSIINGGAWSEDEYVDVGIPVLRVSNMVAGTVVSKDNKFLSESSRHTYEKHEIVDRDILIATVGSHPTQQGSVVGRTVRVPSEWSGAYLNQNAACLRVHDVEAVDPDFLWHLTKTILFKHHIESRARGSANQVRMAIGELKKFEYDFPEIETQRKIAAILTPYDDLIEINKRRIALLENMAEEIYREWFVRMRFPGYQNTKFAKGVPEGWPLKRFTELVEINPRESIHKSEPVPYVGMENLSQSSMHFASHETRTGASGSKFRNRDTLLPRITPSLENGKRGFVTCLQDQQVGLGSTEFIVFREKVLPAEYIYFLTCNSSFRQHAELSMTGASGRQRVQQDCFDYIFISAPPEDIRNKFVEITRPVFESICHFAAQIKVLTQTRDLLLPRLISGKLSVENLDIQFPPSMLGETAEPESADA